MDTTDNFFNIEQLLRDGNTIKLKPQGYSMYPLFYPGRDEAIIEPVDPSDLRRGDVALYRRRQSILVLHRIWKIREQKFYMVGDNQSEIEGPLDPDQFLGRLCGFVRNGHTISVKNPLYRILSSLWLRMLPVRPVVYRTTRRLRQIKKRSQNQKNPTEGQK